MKTSPGSCLLKVSGILLDEIRYFDAANRVGPSESSELDQAEISETVDNIENAIRTAISESPAKFRCLHPNTSDTLWRTLVTNIHIIGSTLHTGDKTPPASYGDMFEVFRGRKQMLKNFRPELHSPERKQEYVTPIVVIMRLGDQRFLMASNGRMGLGPYQLWKDDKAVFFFGADMPFLIRHVRAHYRLLGPAYVHSLMNGKGLSSRAGDGWKQSAMLFTLCWQYQPDPEPQMQLIDSQHVAANMEVPSACHVGTNSQRIDCIRGMVTKIGSVT
jgi:hypothetical protein